MRLIQIASDFNPKPGEIHSFISPVNYFKLSETKRLIFHCDGLLAAFCLSGLTGKKINRMSFDLGSVARTYLLKLQERHSKVLFLGGRPEELPDFSANIRKIFPTLDFDCISGYPGAGGFNENVIDQILTSAHGCSAIVVSLGAPLQEIIASKLHAHGFQGVLITAGAFVSQTAKSTAGNYYPNWINKLHLRFLWRLIKEPHTRKRFPLVFAFPFALAVDIIRGKTHINLAENSNALIHYHDHLQ